MGGKPGTMNGRLDSGGGVMLKRTMDFLFSFLLMVLLLPFLLVIAILVKLTSKGTVLFKQKRIGAEGKEFDMYKFRTMYADAPMNVATHLLENPETHITPIGRVLRKTSLDELPQLFNIVKGDMSFIGPRPALYNQYDLIELRNSMGIGRIKPGITGWAQVNGRDELEIPEKVRFDKYYLEHMSFFLDIKILFLTFNKVLLGQGVVEGGTGKNVSA